MDTLKIENRASAMTCRGNTYNMKETVCGECGKKIRFMIAIPRFCPGCYADTTLPSNLFETVEYRLHYYKGNKDDYY